MSSAKTISICVWSEKCGNCHQFEICLSKLLPELCEKHEISVKSQILSGLTLGFKLIFIEICIIYDNFKFYTLEI